LQERFDKLTKDFDNFKERAAADYLALEKKREDDLEAA
jgi:hypothetical protein